MKLLLDTCTFLWWVSGSDKFSAHARRLCTDPAHTVFLSAASAWEMSVKHARGKLPMDEAPHAFVARATALLRIRTISVRMADVEQLATLPGIHADPFDRMLICQALARDLVLVTPDPEIRKYPVRTAW